MTKSELLSTLRNKFKQQMHYVDDEVIGYIDAILDLKVEYVKDILEENHRHYKTSISIYKVYSDDINMYLGIRNITNRYDEMTEYEDCMVDYEFYDIKKIITTTYEINNEL